METLLVSHAHAWTDCMCCSVRVHITGGSYGIKHMLWLLTALSDVVCMRRQVRAGVEERVKAAMSHGGLLQAELDGLKACHDKALHEAYSHTSQLQEQLGEQQQQLEETGQELSRCQQALDRCVFGLDSVMLIVLWQPCLVCWVA